MATKAHSSFSLPAVVIALLAAQGCGSQPGGEPSTGQTPAQSAGEAAAPDSPLFIQEVTWSPDGSRLVFSRLDVDAMQYRIYSINADGSHLTPLTGADHDRRWRHRPRRVVSGR